MAGIDYTIPGQIRGIQIEPPENAMMRAMQLRGLQESAQMNALKMQEYQRAHEEKQEMARQRNALAQYLANPKKPTDPMELEAGVRQAAPLLADQWIDAQLKRGELGEKIEGRKYQNFERKFKLFQSVTPTIKNIDDVSKFVSASYADPDLGPVLQQIRPYEDALNANLDAFNDDPENWRLQAAGVSPKEIAEIARNKDKEERAANKPVVVGNRLVTPKGKVLFEAPSGEKESDLARLQRERARIAAENKDDPRLAQYDAAIAKLTAPTGESDLARLQRERADIAAKNPDDPRLKQYDAAIAKTTATNQPLSDLARKQNELALLEEQLKDDPNNKLLQQRIKEYRDDIRKDTQFRPVTNVSVAAPVTPVTIVDPKDPSKTIVVDGRTGKIIGQGIKEPSGVQLSAKEIQIREAKRPQATAAIKTFESKAQSLAQDLQKLANHPGLSGISGVIFGRTPSGTKDSMAAQALYESIVARGGFKELQDMRAASPTGGALGNVSNQEGQYLRDAFAPISRTQDTSTLKQALLDAAQAVTESKNRIREAFDMTYEYRSGDASNAAPAAPKSDVRSKADAILGK